ncbi:alpha amylase, catalytic domain protein [Dictyocaulus viviparus]|uniref:Alpha amylase, catalytic domain protein n=1 Tax=Dictyocaulus viviparus TaxID=29172 RepID=A0A0D8Y7H0_DICVI|nr:alpha amylase, catalytic domain protein [Dictyocaulus viviparus]
MGDSNDNLMPGPQGKTPHFYDVDRGAKTESYITAVSRNPVPPIHPSSKHVTYNKDDDDVSVQISSTIRQKDRSSDKEDTVGLTEEELEPYRDNPRWKCTRMVLFVLFWIVWLLLFGSAIVLVVVSPGCHAKAKPNWWQTAITYSIWVPSFQDSDDDGYGDMQGVVNRLENLRKSGIQAVWPVPFLISDDFSNAIRSFDQMDPKLGVNQLADQVIANVHDKGMKFVISLPVATTSLEHEWFLKSSSASIPANQNYSSFYHWRNQAPSKFFSKHNGLFYMHEENDNRSAILNWQNTDVRSHMFNVISSWIERGVDGFYLIGIEYLVRSSDGSIPNWPAIADVISDIRDHIDSFTNESSKVAGKKIALFASRDDAKEKDKKQLVSSGLDSVINYELSKVRKDSDICNRNDGIAVCAHEILSDILLFHSNNPAVWPQWEFGNPWVSRLASRVESRAHAELLLMLQLLLPGTNNFYYGDELGMKDLQNSSIVPAHRGAMQWDDTFSAGFSSNPKIPVNPDYKDINWARQYSQEQSTLKLFSKLSKLRTKDDALMSGKTIIGRLIDNAFTIVRFYTYENETVGSIYIAAVNFAVQKVSLPLVDVPKGDKLKKCQIVTITSNVDRYFPRQTVDFSSKSVELFKDEGIVFRYTA